MHYKKRITTRQWQIAFMFHTGGGGVRTSFCQLNCDPLDFSLYAPSLEFPRNSYTALETVKIEVGKKMPT